MPRQHEIRKAKDGMCRRIAAQLDAHHRRINEQRSHDTPREVCCSSFAFMLKGGDFQVANSYRVSIVAKSARGGAGNFRGVGRRYRRVHATAQNRDGADRSEGGRGRNGREQQAEEGGASDSKGRQRRRRGQKMRRGMLRTEEVVKGHFGLGPSSHRRCGRGHAK